MCIHVGIGCIGRTTKVIASDAKNHLTHSNGQSITSVSIVDNQKHSVFTFARRTAVSSVVHMIEWPVCES